MAYFGATMGATWNAQAVWGATRRPDLDAALERLHRHDPRPALAPEVERQSREFDEMRMRVRLRVAGERASGRPHG